MVNEAAVVDNDNGSSRNMGDSAEVVIFNNGCSGLMYCGPNSICSITDVCITEFEHNGLGLIVTAMDAIYNVKNSYYYLNNNNNNGNSLHCI